MFQVFDGRTANEVWRKAAREFSVSSGPLRQQSRAGSTLEILHAWSFVKSLEWERFSEILSMSQGVSIAVLLFIIIFFGLRLKFINSVKGEFYEQEILASPRGITRWRDALDNLVIAQFFDRKRIFGRIFVDPSRK